MSIGTSPIGKSQFVFQFMKWPAQEVMTFAFLNQMIKQPADFHLKYFLNI